MFRFLCFVSTFLACHLVVHADDVYLKSGFVYRNVKVIDTTAGVIRVAAEKNTFSISLDRVARIEKLEVAAGSKTIYELYSEEANREFLRQQQERSRREQERGTVQASDSMERAEGQLNTVQPWRNSVYLAAGGGSPQGFRGELGYNFGSYISVAFSFGIGDSWSHDPGEGTIAVLGTIRFPTDSPSMTPYLLLCSGGTIAIFGGSDTYTLVYAGVLVPLIPALQVRPEVGVDFTSKHISGGHSLFGGDSPEVRGQKTMLGFHLSLELDLARLF